MAAVSTPQGNEGRTSRAITHETAQVAVEVTYRVPQAKTQEFKNILEQADIRITTLEPTPHDGATLVRHSCPTCEKDFQSA